MNKFAKVEGHEALVRDMSSHAIISTSDSEFESYKRSRDNILRQRSLINKQAEEISILKSEMAEIKQMLSTLIKGK